MLHCAEWIVPASNTGSRPVSILCLAREFDAEANEKIVRKAIQYTGRGVVGIDLLVLRRTPSS